MKRTVLFTGLILLIQTTSMSAPSQGTAIIKKAPANQQSANPHPKTRQVNARMRTQWTKISEAKKSGKITPSQADQLNASLRDIRQKEVDGFKQNGSHELTSDQQSRINQTLDANDKTLGVSTKPSTK